MKREVKFTVKLLLKIVLYIVCINVCFTLISMSDTIFNVIGLLLMIGTVGFLVDEGVNIVKFFQKKTKNTENRKIDK